MKLLAAISISLNERRHIFLFLCFLFVFSLFGEEKDRTHPINEKCLSCHRIGSAYKGKFKINEKYFSASVHAHLKCTDCHQVTLRDTEEDIPHEKDLPYVNCTSKCHREEQQIRAGLSPLNYSDSIHGKSFFEKGVQDVAKCWDCHGEHNIKNPSDLNSRANRKNIPRICSVCHGDFTIIFKYHTHCKNPSQEYLDSVHGKALYQDGLLFFAATCIDCHGIHNIRGVKNPNFRAKRPETCGKCHVLVFNEYKESIHGREALNGNKDVPLCIDCHGEHKIISPLDEEAPTSWKNVSYTCSACHTRPKIVRKYGIPEDGIESFIKSSHGIAIDEGNKAAANCASCHGFHDIRPADDYFSRVNPANLTKTCGQENCHPGITDKIANSRIHIDISQKKSGSPLYIQQALFLIVFITAVITVVWFLPAFIKKLNT